MRRARVRLHCAVANNSTRSAMIIRRPGQSPTEASELQSIKLWCILVYGTWLDLFGGPVEKRALSPAHNLFWIHQACSSQDGSSAGARPPGSAASAPAKPALCPHARSWNRVARATVRGVGSLSARLGVPWFPTKTQEYDLFRIRVGQKEPP